MTDKTNGSASLGAELEHLSRAANDALTDDMVTRIAQTAADGIDLVDQINRTGVAKAIPVLAKLIENGDLDRLVALTRVVGSAEDALTDDMVSRIAETASEGLMLVDQAHRAGIGKALEPFARLIANGDLDRIVALARVWGAAEDALTDDMIGRVVEAASEGLFLLDRFHRGGAGQLLCLIERMQANGSLDRMVEVVPRLTQRLDHVESLLTAFDNAVAATQRSPKARGGIGGIMKVMRDAETQEAMRFLAEFGKELRKLGSA
mgnify:CR=1 FL=1